MINGKQPIIILREGTTREKGKDARSNNIMAAMAISDAVKSTLGPKGMDKMLVDSMGDVIITNDGVTILDEMEIEHPAAKMIVEVAKVQEDEIGDGTTTAVILSGELLKNAEELLDKNIHPTIIAKGYKLATEKVQEILKEISEEISIDNKDILIKIAKNYSKPKAEYLLNKLKVPYWFPENYDGNGHFVSKEQIFKEYEECTNKRAEINGYRTSGFKRWRNQIHREVLTELRLI